MNEANFKAIIKSKHNTYTEAERKVADVIISDTHAFSDNDMTVSTLANKADVAPSAVIRFCRKSGIASFRDLKLMLAVESYSREHLYAPNVDINDDSSSIADKVFASGMTTLKDTIRLLDREALSRLVDTVLNAEKIFIFGVGTSAPLVCDAAYRLLQLGYPVFSSNDVVSMKMLTMNIERNDLAIGISHSGRTIATVDAIALSHEKGAHTACITTFSESPLYRSADIGITICSEESRYKVEAISSRLAHMCVLDSIAVSLATAKHSVTAQRMTETDSLLSGLRYSK